MTSEKRKAQQRDSKKRTRAQKKKEGYVGFTCLIKPEWKKPILDFIKSLKSKDTK
jgi:glutaredoxin-related protein